MKSRSLACLIFALFALPVSGLAQPDYYAKAKEIALFFPAEIEGFRTDSLLMIRNEASPTLLHGIEQMYYNNQSEIVRIIIRDFSENQRLFDEELASAPSSGPEDISVFIAYPFRYYHEGATETVTIFLSTYTTLEVIHENIQNRSYVPILLKELNLADINRYQGIN